MKILGFCFLFTISVNLVAQIDKGLVSDSHDSKNDQSIASEQHSYDYLALGDSYTLGISVPTNKSWPILLANSLKAKGMSIDSTTIVAKTYWRTDQLLEAAAERVGEKKYDIVSLLIGMSNEYHKQDTSIFAKEFIACLTYAIAHCKNGKDGVFVVSIPDYSHLFYGEKLQKKVRKRIDQYNQTCERIAKNFQVAFYNIFPISRQWETNPALLAQGRANLSVEQYKLWVEHFSCDVYQQFHSDIQPCIETDRGYIAHQYYMEYERLKGIGRYEKASVKLANAFSSRGLTEHQRARSAQLKELQFLIENELSDTLKYEFRMEIAQNALDTSDTKNWTLKEWNLKSAYIASAKYYYEEAQKYLSKPTALEAEIEVRILDTPMDTVYMYDPFINSHIYAKSQYIGLYQHSYGLSQFTLGDTLFNSRDSSLYNGVLIKGSNIEYLKTQIQHYTQQTASGVESFLSIQNGLIISTITNSYSSVSIYDTLQNLNTYFYRSSTSMDNRSSFFQFNHLGDTMVHQYNNINGDGYLKLNVKKDTVEYRRNFIDNGILVTESVNYRANGDTNYFSRTENFSDSIRYLQMHKNQEGDIEEFSIQINEKLHGKQWESYYHNENNRLIKIVREWRYDTLINIYNDSIIYVNEQNEIISQKEYIHILNNLENSTAKHELHNYYEIEKEMTPNQDVLFIFSLNSMYGRKRKKVARSILKQHKKSKP